MNKCVLRDTNLQMVSTQALLDRYGDLPRVSLKTDKTSLHSNLVSCIVVGKDRPVSIESAQGIVYGDAVFVAANWNHVVDFHGGTADVLYLESNCSGKFGGARVARITQAPLQLLYGNAATWSTELADTVLAEMGVRSIPQDSAVDALLDAIARDPMMRLGASYAAKLVGVERTSLLRRFKNHTGMTFRGYKTWIALKRAGQLMLSGQPIGTSALDCGFADAAHFSRQFKATFGLSPTQASRCVM